jgi:hypothetical protein
MKTKWGWKAVRIGTTGSIYKGCVMWDMRFLYHPHEGSRIIPVDKWLEAKARWVRKLGDRNKTSRAYRAGFQFLATRADVERFNELTKGKYSFIRVRVRQTWRKPTKGSKSMMARFLFVPNPIDATFY